MIYSQAFEGLPDLVKEKVFERLRSELSGETENHLGAREKKAIF